MSTIALRGPARVVVTQHRRALQIMAAVPVLTIAVLVGTWLWTEHVANAFAATGCSVVHTVPSCADTVSDFLDRQLWMPEVLKWSGVLMTALPPFVGIFVAGPVIAHELESGTYKVAWSQSMTPARWLAAELTVPAVVTLASVLTDTFKNGSDYRFPAGAVDTGHGRLTSSGRRLPADACLDWATDLKQCLADKDITLRYLDYHPVSHFWPLQLVETGILLALAALAVALAFRVLRRHHG
ncbi:hypothetical protein ACFXPY_12475 [Streptomyces sp. NPDC059153]|uniref:hypothetical protein n=1 Tax=Streptomyces sp. NPDC059153 TaxID=3346743 RepID=UPI0036C7C338